MSFRSNCPRIPIFHFRASLSQMTQVSLATRSCSKL